MTSLSEPIASTIDDLVADGTIDEATARVMRARLGVEEPDGQADAPDGTPGGVLAGQSVEEADGQASDIRVDAIYPRDDADGHASGFATSDEGPDLDNPERCVRCGSAGWPLCPSCSSADAARLPRAEETARSLSVRAWAVEQGLAVGSRGRIPHEIIRAWRAANPDAPRPDCEAAMLRYEAEHGTRPSPPPLRRLPTPQPPVPTRLPDAPAERRRIPTPPDPPPPDRPRASRSSLLGVDGLDDGPIPSRESGVVLDRAPGEIVLSDGLSVDLTIVDPTRDAAGRVVCPDCNQAFVGLACGCDPGEHDDDGVPLDPRWATGAFLP